MKGRHLLGLGLGLALADVLVPYLLLRSIASFTASFLFWCLITFAMVLFGILATRGWGGRP